MTYTGSHGSNIPTHAIVVGDLRPSRSSFVIKVPKDNQRNNPKKLGY